MSSTNERKQDEHKALHWRIKKEHQTPNTHQSERKTSHWREERATSGQKESKSFSWANRQLIMNLPSTCLTFVFFGLFFNAKSTQIFAASDSFTHTNQHLKLLSKYILFWTFVSFIWQKKEQMDVMNQQTNRRKCGRDTSAQDAHQQHANISSYRRHGGSESIRVQVELCVKYVTS